jgi:hypothetical protein
MSTVLEIARGERQDLRGRSDDRWKSRERQKPTQTPVPRLLERVDRIKLGCYFRRIELLLGKDDVRGARMVFAELLEDYQTRPLTLQSSIHDAFEAYTAAALEQAGCETVADAGRVGARKIAERANGYQVASKRMAAVHDMVDRIRRGETVYGQRTDGDAKLEPDWPAPAESAEGLVGRTSQSVEEDQP